MHLRTTSMLVVGLALTALTITGCERSTKGLRPFPLPTDPVVFEDSFGGVDFQAFLGSKLDALSVDPVERHSGTTSLKFTVPDAGAYAGGAFTTRTARDLSGYDALTFWAKASRPITLDVAGFGNDNTGTSRFEARWNAIPVTTTWTRFVIPIPLPERLASERGLFYLAEGPENGVGCELWFDDIRFERVGNITNPRPAMAPRSVSSFVGADLAITGTQTVFAVDGVDRTVGHMPGYFSYTSSNPGVAAVSNGTVRLVGGGSATVTAALGTVPAAGRITVNSIAPPSAPAPAPTLPAADVISLYSNAYPNRPVSTWSATWDVADVTDLRIAGDDVKGYTGMGYAGIEFPTQTVDSAAVTHFHIDVFVPIGTTFKVKLVDFGPNGVYLGGDDREQELAFNASTTPAMVPGTWSSLDIPLANFTNLTTRAHLTQIVLSGAGTAFVDNIYFHR